MYGAQNTLGSADTKTVKFDDRAQQDTQDKPDQKTVSYESSFNDHQISSSSFPNPYCKLPSGAFSYNPINHSVHIIPPPDGKIKKDHATYINQKLDSIRDKNPFLKENNGNDIYSKMFTEYLNKPCIHISEHSDDLDALYKVGKLLGSVESKISALIPESALLVYPEALIDVFLRAKKCLGKISLGEPYDLDKGSTDINKIRSKHLGYEATSDEIQTLDKQLKDLISNVSDLQLDKRQQYYIHKHGVIVREKINNCTDDAASKKVKSILEKSTSKPDSSKTFETITDALNEIESCFSPDSAQEGSSKSESIGSTPKLQIFETQSVQKMETSINIVQNNIADIPPVEKPAEQPTSKGHASHTPRNFIKKVERGWKRLFHKKH